MVKSNKKNLAIFLLPALIFSTIFIFFPIVNTLILSLVNKQGEFGLDNFIYLFTEEPQFTRALFNTFIYAVTVTFAEMTLALIIAYLLSKKIKFKNTFQTIFFLPYVTSVVAIGAVFRYMFHSEYGIINMIIESFGGEGLKWLSDPHLVLVSIIILGIWKGLAFNVLIIFTGLSTTNEEIEKAAIIDNFSPKQVFYRIKLPQIKPVLTYLLVMNIIFNFKVYEEVVALFPTGGVAADYASTLVYLLKDKTLTDPELAAAIAVVLLVIVISLRYLVKLLGYISKKIKFKGEKI